MARQQNKRISKIQRHTGNRQKSLYETPAPAVSAYASEFTRINNNLEIEALIPDAAGASMYFAVGTSINPYPVNVAFLTPPAATHTIALKQEIKDISSCHGVPNTTKHNTCLALTAESISREFDKALKEARKKKATMFDFELPAGKYKATLIGPQYTKRQKVAQSSQ